MPRDRAAESFFDPNKPRPVKKLSLKSEDGVEKEVIGKRPSTVTKKEPLSDDYTLLTRSTSEDDVKLPSEKAMRLASREPDYHKRTKVFGDPPRAEQIAIATLMRDLQLSAERLGGILKLETTFTTPTRIHSADQYELNMTIKVLKQHKESPVTNVGLIVDKSHHLKPLEVVKPVTKKPPARSIGKMCMELGVKRKPKKE